MAAAEPPHSASARSETGPGRGWGSSRHQEPAAPSLLSELARFGWQALLLIGVLAVVLGIIVLSWPRSTLIVVGVIFGLYLVISGVLQLFAATAVHGHSGHKVFGFVSGALSILLGLFCFRGSLESLLLLGLWIGIGWLFRGISAMMSALDAPSGSAGRGWSAFLGFVVAVAGIILITDPFGSIAALTLMAGIWLIIIGVVEIGHAISLRSRLRHLGSAAEPGPLSRGTT
jgi:uncharacterized membrane protein HdeD (DUF308 family)